MTSTSLTPMATLQFRLQKAWNSTNFWQWVGMFFFIVFVNATQEDITPIVSGIISTALAAWAGFNQVRNFIKDKGISFRWSRVVNGIGYLGLIINALLPFDIPDSLWTGIQDLIQYAGAGDWSGFIAALWPILIVVFNLIRDNKKPKPETA
jgi:hypothetical protein